MITPWRFAYRKIPERNALMCGLWLGVRNAGLLSVPVWLLLLWVLGEKLTLLAAGALFLGEIVLLHLVSREKGPIETCMGYRA